MQNIQTKKTKLNLQIRSLGKAAEPVVETDMESLGGEALSGVTGGFEQMAFGKTRGCSGEVLD